MLISKSITRLRISDSCTLAHIYASISVTEFKVQETIIFPKLRASLESVQECTIAYSDVNSESLFNVLEDSSYEIQESRYVLTEKDVAPLLLVYFFEV